MEKWGSIINNNKEIKIMHKMNLDLQFQPKKKCTKYGMKSTNLNLIDKFNTKIKSSNNPV